MMAGKKGYRDVMNFSDDGEMLTDYFGLIARGERYFFSHYINVNEGKQILSELTQAEAEEIQKEYTADGWTLAFVEKWTNRI